VVVEEEGDAVVLEDVEMLFEMRTCF